MVKIKNITQFWKKQSVAEDFSGLVASFKELAAMRRYVPYLKDVKFNQNSLQSGDTRSAFKGRGMEFEEVRAYNFGDDVRDIDWRVTARKNQPFTKLYAEEKDREVYVWLDLSAPMRFGTKTELKSVTAAKTAALLGWFALENKDRFGAAVFDGHKTYFFEASRTYDQLFALLKKFESIAKDSLQHHNDSNHIKKSLQLLHKKISRKSIVFLISDFNHFEQNFSAELSKMVAHNEVYLTAVYDLLEVFAPPEGEYLAKYGEKQQLLISSGKNFSTQYQAYFAKKRSMLKQFCKKFHCQYREIRTDLAIYNQLKPI